MELKKVKRTGIAFTISEEDRRKFRAKLVERGETMSGILREWIKNYLTKG